MLTAVLVTCGLAAVAFVLAVGIVVAVTWRDDDPWGEPDD